MTGTVAHPGSLLTGFDIEVPFTGGRGDATPEWTDSESFAVMEPVADGFRNYLKASIVGKPRSCCSTGHNSWG